MKKKKLPKIHPAQIPESDYLCWKVWSKHVEASGIVFDPDNPVHCLAYATFLIGWIKGLNMNLEMIEAEPEIDEIEMWITTSKAEAVSQLLKYGKRNLKLPEHAKN